jgi:Lar family restriction alleviation protein
MSALLPCPFCGGEAEYDNADDSAARWVWCKGCGAKVAAEFSDEAATAAWNRRHVPEGFALVPVEPTTDMLQDGQMAARKARRPAVSGMAIDTQVRAECAVEAAIYRAMLAAAAKETKP